MMEGKWLIADRDLNEREGLKWLLKATSIPVAEIMLASDYQEFVLLFERENPDVVLLELDMISRGDWSTFRELLQIYDPILLLASAEATFEKARLAIDLQALDLIIKPFSTTKVKMAFQKAARLHGKRFNPSSESLDKSFKDLSYEALFLPQTHMPEQQNSYLAAFKAETAQSAGTLHSFLFDFPFKKLDGIYGLSDMVILLFNSAAPDITEQCRKAMRKWEEEFPESLAVVIHTGHAPLHEKFTETQIMLQFTYFKGYSQVMEFNASPNWVHIDPFLDPPSQRTWIEMLTHFDLEKIKTWLYQEFLQKNDPFPDPGLVRIRLTSILAQVRRFMKTYNLNEQENYESSYRYIFNSILYDTVLYRTVQNLILFIQKLFQGIKSNAGNFKPDPIERGISFMESNFSKKELKLEDVAHHVERNPSYFSHLLMSKTGKGFTELLTGIRIKEAKRLLLESSKSVKEISGMVGFQNPNYFSRMFKDTVGFTPREYRYNKVLARFEN